MPLTNIWVFLAVLCVGEGGKLGKPLINVLDTVCVCICECVCVCEEWALTNVLILSWAL